MAVTPEQIAKAKKIIAFGRNPQSAIFNELQQISEGLDEVVELFGDVDINALKKIKGEKGDPGANGKDGQTGPEGQAGPEGRAGDNGQDGRPGEEGPEGQAGPEGRAGDNGRNGSPDTAFDIRAKLESLRDSERLDALAIKGLDVFFPSRDEYNRAIEILDRRTQFLINKQSSGTGVVKTIVAGTGITVDATDPANPIVSATGSGTRTPVYNEVLSGTVDGSNTTFTLLHAPLTGSLRLYNEGGQRLRPGPDFSSSTTDYTLTGTTVVLAVPPNVMQPMGDYDM